MVERVSKYILQHHLMEMDKKYLLALSGGADSVCLLLILKQLGYSIEAVHCNFHLRGEESDRDEQFCVSFCEKQQVPLHLIHFDTREYAALHHLSIEMAARELRYHYFAALCRDLQSDGVCVAHHQDDSVETVLLNLIRGTGVHGLTGIAPLSILESDLKVIRPLLCMTRDEIEQFLQDISQDYVTDSTNLQADMAVRNKIRMEVIPLLQQINPSVNECIALSAHHIQEAAKVFDAAMKTHVAKVMTDNRISIKMLKTLPSPEYTLYTILKDYGFSSLQVEQISQRLDAEAGTVFSSATHELLVDREDLIIEQLFVPAKPMRIPEPGTYLYPCASNGTRHDEDSIRFRFSLTKMNMGDIPHDKHTACLDAATVSFPLTIRPVQQGDRFQPFGMKGSKLVSDYLTDRKCSLFEKRRQLVVTDSTNRIVWLVNQRPNDCCRVTELTKEVLLITIS